ncbi:Protein unc-79 homolog [Eumeta japonica]|uniref:Protein unc-79 homolog n=1 Tax=Eumeta variegata TaxID=151549 RepID=A0A4C1UQZ5_EUMVA|nr:Protein unc-79 homolog [Eumeta japonica]
MSYDSNDSTDKTDSSKSEQEPASRPQDLSKKLSSEGSKIYINIDLAVRRLADLHVKRRNVLRPMPSRQRTPKPRLQIQEVVLGGRTRLGAGEKLRMPRLTHVLKQTHYAIAVCSECGTSLDQYSDEELGLCVIVLATFIHREPGAAAPMLPNILHSVSRVVQMGNYSWQNETNIRLPGSAVAVAHQFLRCILHQLAPNNVFVQIFMQKTPEKQRLIFFKSIAQAFVDFNELYPCGPLQLVVEHLNSKKTLPTDQLSVITGNIAMYLECLAPEALGPLTACVALLQQLEQLFRGVALVLHLMDDVHPLLRSMCAALRIPGASQCKNILEPFSKILSYSVQNFVLRLSVVSELSVQCVRVFQRDRDKLLVCRVLVYELVQALKTKTTIPDENFFVLIQFVLQGHGATLLLPPQLNVNNQIGAAHTAASADARELGSGAVDCMRPHLPDILDLLQEPQLIDKIKGSVSKSIVNRNLVCLNEDTLGAIVKGGIAQYVALELALEQSRGKQERTTTQRHMTPWLSPAIPGGRELAECVSRVRLVSWLVIGALSNTTESGTIQPPIPQDATCHITDHVQTIMSSYVEQWKPTAQRMTPLCHAFILCQLWTVYLEEIAAGHAPNTESYNITCCLLLDFWCKIVPSVLQVTVQSKVLAETVNLHFLGLLEALLECNSTVLNKLLPLWTPILHSPLFALARAVVSAQHLARYYFVKYDSQCADATTHGPAFGRMPRHAARARGAASDRRRDSRQQLSCAYASTPAQVAHQDGSVGIAAS